MHCGDYIRSAGKMTNNVSGIKFFKEHAAVCSGTVSDNGDKAPLPEQEKFIVPFILNMFISFICVSKISFVQASSKLLCKLIYCCMELARRFPLIPLERIFPCYDRTTLSRKINKNGKKLAFENVNNYRDRDACVIWDAGKSLLIFLFVTSSFI
jgi:hypothetical protein